VLVPTFEIAANPTVRLCEIKARRLKYKGVYKPNYMLETPKDFGTIILMVIVKIQNMIQWAISRKDYLI